MKKAFGCLMMIVFLILAYFFFQSWRGIKSWGVGTGNISGPSSSAPSTPGATNKRSALSQVAASPQKWNGKRVTVSGRVRGNTRYASNRNLYRLTDGKSTLLVVDDKAPAKEYSLRSVKGIVKVVKPPVGNGYAYIVSVKGDPKIDLKWDQVKGVVGGAIGEIKKGVHEATR